MVSPKTQKQPQPKIVVGAKSSPGKVAMMPDTVSSQDRIRERAYELYEGRGREAGQDEQDRFRAEREILNLERSRDHHAPPPVNLLEGWRNGHGLPNLQGSGTSF